MPDKYNILPISKMNFEKNMITEAKSDILPLEHPKLTRTKRYFKSEQIIFNVQNKITHKNKKIIFTKKKPINIDTV